MADGIRFAEPLTEGVVLERSSMYTMLVDIAGEQLRCHCPTTGRIGTVEIGGRPCLLSRSADPKRKTPYTVEAVSLDRPDDSVKSWIGINQSAVNRYTEHYLVNGGFAGMVGTGNTVKREQTLGDSKLDFLVGDTYLEVKTPLQQLQVPIPDHVKMKKHTPFSSTDRFVKHITGLADSLKDHERAILLTCFIYDNPCFEVIERSTNYDDVRAAVSRSTERGVEMWQANYRLTPEGVSLDRYFRLHL